MNTMVEINRIRNETAIIAEQTRKEILKNCTFEEINANEYLRACFE